jgi:hypothetical protein
VFRKLYDFDLTECVGQITGWLLDEDSME